MNILLFWYLHVSYFNFWQVRINITDDNVRPFFAQPVYRKEVEENLQLRDFLMITVTANDTKKDGVVPCNCTYSIKGTVTLFYIYSNWSTN